MKRIGILAMAAIAAMAFMAGAGAGTASATLTSLCKKDTTITGLPKCEGGHLWQKETKIHAPLEAGTAFKLETGLGVVECSESTLEAITEQVTEKPLGASVKAFTFGECQSEGEPVEVVALNNGTLDIEIIDLPVWTHNGTLTFTETEIGVYFEELEIECIYEPGHSGILKGGKIGTVALSGTWPRVAGAILCGATAKANAAYLASPENLWVST